VPTVKTCPLDSADLVAQFSALGREHGFRIETIGVIGEDPIIALTKRASGPRPRIYISSGVHGDEPAPPQALFQLLRRGAFDESANWFLVPMLNPSGFRLHQRNNAQNIDLNRDYLNPVTGEVQSHVRWLQFQPRFDLALCLHEDWESHGFYLYELNSLGRTSLALKIRAAAEAHMPIERDEIIDGRAIDERGIIRPESDPKLRENWPEAIYLRQHHADLGYTLESSSALPLGQRIETHCASVAAAIASVCSD